MNLLKKARLAFQDGASDKVYEVDLLDLENGKSESYLVNFRYGRRGSKLREGTKTLRPVDLQRAQKLYDSVVTSKLIKGYTDVDQPQSQDQQADSVAPASVPPSSTEDMANRLEQALTAESSSKKRARIIWRLAELGAAQCLPAIVNSIKRGDWLEDYSIAWAIGRLQAKQYSNDLAGLQQHSHPAVCRIAQEAYLNIASKEQMPSELQSAVSQWSEQLQKALGTDNVTELNNALGAELKSDSTDKNLLLRTLYQYSHFHPWVKSSLLKLLSTIEFKPGTFKGIRAIYKAAELRKDADVYALLAYRFETGKHFYRAAWSWAYAPGVGYINADKEKKKPEPRIAYSERTRDYFRRRVWRTAQRMGSANDPAYLDFASTLLLSFSDNDAGEARKSEVYRYEQRSNRWENILVAVNEYDTFAGYLAFNHILYHNSEKYTLTRSGRAWRKTEGDDGDRRVEAFPELWDQNPTRVVQLLLHSRCAPVHAFAVRILKDHPNVTETIPLEQLTELLRSPYSDTAQFALSLARQKLVAEARNFSLICALLSSTLQDARDLGLEAFVKLEESDLQNLGFIVQVLLIRYKDVLAAILEKLSSCNFSSTLQQQLLRKLVDTVMLSGSSKHDPYAESHMQKLSGFIAEKLSAPAKEFPIAIIESLLHSRDSAQQLLGGQLLLLNAIDFHSIPEHLITQINSASSSAVRAIAAALLGKQSDQELAAQSGLLVQLYMQGDAEERAALVSVFQRIVTAEATATEVLNVMLEHAFSTRADEGLIADLSQFAETYLSAVFHGVQLDLLWRSVQAKSKLSQALGSLIMLQRSPEEFSVRQWSILAKNPNQSLRQYAQNAFSAHAEAARKFRNEALQMLETDWLDTREFGFNYFREVYGSEDWDPDTIIYLCDSVRDDVQAFGREVLQRFFEQQQGYHYLEKLSQHPSVNVQLFASSLLEDYAGGNDERICALRPYYISVMSQVYRGRICKDRVIAFLLVESQRSKEVACFAAEIFERISLTVVHKDKSSLIKAMLALKQLYPDLELMLEQRDPAIKATA